MGSKNLVYAQGLGWPGHRSGGTNVKYSVGFYDTFRPRLKELTQTEQGAVMNTIVELSETPDSPGLNVHRVGDAATKCWSARVNDDIRPGFFRSENVGLPAPVPHADPPHR